MTLRTATFSATRWTTASAVIRAGVQVLQTAALARLLVPADFGLMALASVALAVVALFLDLGINSALMHFEVPDQRTLSALYWLNLGAACILALLIAGLGWPLGLIYGQPELAPLLACLALGFPLAALGQQFRVLAEKALNFKPLAQNEVASALASFAVALAAAWLGWGIYAIVAGQLAGAGLNTALAWLRLSNGFRPQACVHWPSIRPFVAFGLHRMGDGFWNTALTQADVFIAGLVAPPHAVATYAVPREQSLKIANTVINPVITRVGLPVMTRLKDDPTALRAIYLKTLRLTASFNFPLYALLALFAEPIVLLLLGSQWHEAVPFLRLFALWCLIRSVGNPSGSLLYAVGMAKRAHAWNLLRFLVAMPVFWFAAQLGGLPALTGTILVWQCVMLVSGWRFLIRPACGLSFATYFANLLPPLACTALAAACAYALATALPPLWHLPVGAVAFGITYLAASARLNREWLTTTLEVFAPLKKLLK